MQSITQGISVLTYTCKPIWTVRREAGPPPSQSLMRSHNIAWGEDALRAETAEEEGLKRGPKYLQTWRVRTGGPSLSNSLPNVATAPLRPGEDVRNPSSCDPTAKCTQTLVTSAHVLKAFRVRTGTLWKGPMPPGRKNATIFMSKWESPASTPLLSTATSGKKRRQT